MQGRSDSSTQELSRLKLKLDVDLVFTPHRYGNTTYYHVELPARSKFFRIGVAEYTFVSLLDGDTTVAEALSLTARSLGRDALSEREAVAACNWLVESGLAQPVHASQAARLYEADHRERSRGLFGRLNPFWLKLPLGCPDRLLKRLLPLVGWIHSKPAVLLTLVLCTAAISMVATHWDRFTASATAVFGPANWLWLGVAFVLLKTLHELGHGVVCRLYGGEVREVGLMFILLVPVPYVDVTSSWRFRSRWQRMHTAMAGMYVELLVAAVAALVWCGTESAVVTHLLYSLMLMASVTTLLFNANPLMRFDGYYIATDLLEIPNLYSRGSRYVSGLARRVFLGLPASARLTWQWRDLTIRVYGGAAICWRVLVCVSLSVAASVLFHGAGLALAVVGLASWLVPPVIRATRALAQQHAINPLTTVRATAIATGLAAAAWFLLCLPWPGKCTAPGVIEYRDSIVARAGSPGFVTAIHVKDGQQVREGDVLLELSNDSLGVEYRDLQLAIEQCEARRRIHLEKQEQAQAQVEAENQRALQKRLAEKQRRLGALVVRAPVTGRVMARGLETLHATYLKEGDEILGIGDDAHKRLRISIAQEDMPSYRPLVGQMVKFRLRASALCEGRLTRVEPRASTEPPHAALCAPLGGPLAVRAVDGEDPEDKYEFTLPRFTGFIELPQAVDARHFAGEFGYVTLRPQRSESIARTLTRCLRDWIDDKVAAAKARWR